MQSTQGINLQQQIEEASKRAKPKKAMYLYDETGNRELLGVFSQKKADQIRRTGARIVATPCHNCIDQLMELNKVYELNVEIKTVAEIVADALILGPQER